MHERHIQFINIHFSKSTMSIIQCIGGFLAILILLYIHYWRRNRDEIVPINWPIIGMLSALLAMNVGNYERGSNFQDIFDFLGDGILNSNSHVWKQQRTMFNSFLKRKTFLNFFRQTMKKKLEKVHF